MPPGAVEQSNPMDEAETIAIVGIAIGIAGLAVAVLTLIQPFWLPRLSEPRRRQRDAADRLRDILLEHHEALTQPDVLTGSPATADLRADLERRLVTIRSDLSPALMSRVAVFELLLRRAEDLDLRAETRWIEVSVYLLTELRIAATAEVNARRPTRRLLVDAETLDDLLARGRMLGSGLEPLRETLLANAQRQDRRGTLRYAIALAVWAAVLGFAIGALVFG